MRFPNLRVVVKDSVPKCVNGTNPGCPTFQQGRKQRTNFWDSCKFNTGECCGLALVACCKTLDEILQKHSTPEITAFAGTLDIKR